MGAGTDVSSPPLQGLTKYLLSKQADENSAWPEVMSSREQSASCGRPGEDTGRVTGRVTRDHHVELGFRALLSLPSGKTKCTIPLAAKVLMV